MAKKIISKGGSSSSGATSGTKHQSNREARFPSRGSSISESNLAGMCNNNGTHQRQPRSGISFNPDNACGRTSPDAVTVYKTKVLYHSRADFRSAGLTSSQNGHTMRYSDQ